MNTFTLYKKYFFIGLIVCCFFIFAGGLAYLEEEKSSHGSIPAYASTLENIPTTKEQTNLETSLLYLLEGLEIWGAWLDPANEVGLLPEAEGRFMIPNTPILQTGGAIPSGIAITGFAQPIVISRDGIPQGFAENEYLYEQLLIKYDDSVEDIFQKVPYLDRLNYQYGVGMDGRTVKVYRKSIEAEFTLLATLQNMGAPPEVAEAWVKEYAKVASLPQTIQLAWLIAGNPLAEVYQPHVKSVLEPLSLSTLQINGAQNTGWVNQDPFWVEAQKQPFIKAFTDLLSNANEEIKRSFIVALFFLEPTSQTTGITDSSDNFALRPKPNFGPNQQGITPTVSSSSSFSGEESTAQGSTVNQSSSNSPSANNLKASSGAGIPNIQIIPREQQNGGSLFNGAFYENRPIPFPEHGKSKGYSNLFYWAHLEAKEKGEFGLHAHEGFEIMTFALKGSLEHYDTSTQKWVPLTAGEVQVIQAGDGVQHSERLEKGSEGFQIWFDPDFSKSLQHKATYQDYKANLFTETDVNGIKTVFYVGDNRVVRK